MTVKKCPKCGTEMTEGILAGAPIWGSGTGIFHREQKKIIAYLCKNYGYAMLYEESK